MNSICIIYAESNLYTEMLNFARQSRAVELGSDLGQLSSIWKMSALSDEFLRQYG